MLPGNAQFTLSEKLKQDIMQFNDKVGDLPNEDFLKNAKIKGLTADKLMKLFCRAFID